jgi:acyl-CoA synthetase (AMP-forming)/AMP-acid ligase II
MVTLNTSVVCVAADSCPEFLRTVFNLYERQQLFAVVRRDVADDPRLAGAERIALVDGPKSGWFRTSYTPLHSDTPAQIVFSSGTEGLPKAIVLTYRNLSDVVERLNAVMHVTSEIREYVGVPVTYSFGLGRVRAVMAAGGAVYVPEKFNPSEIRRMLEQGEINALSAVPSLCRILLNSAEMFKGIGEQLRWIEIGSQYMADDDKAAMRRLFPNARIVQHYGLTEASRSTFIDISEVRPEHLDSVGPIKGTVEIRIDPEGAICIRGSHVASNQLVTATELLPLTDAQGWLITKDRGEIRDGHLYFLGRMDDQINVAGIKLSSEHLEQRITLALPEVTGHFAVAAIADPMRGQLPLIAIEKDQAELLPRIENAMASAMAFYGVSGGETFRSMVVDHLPMTGSGKVQRAQLRNLYKATEKESTPKTWGRTKAAKSVREVYQSHFPQATIAPETTFENLGGDSLNYISVSLELEKLLGELPASWAKMRLAELEQVTTTKHFWNRLDTPTALRALSIMLIISGHFHLLEYGGGGSYVLFFIGGMSFGALSIPAVLQTQRLTPIFILLIRIAIMTWGYITLNWLVTGFGSPLAYLFITNWVAPDYPGGVWFIGVYIQIALGLAFLFAFARIRAIAGRHAFSTALVLTYILILLMTASDLLVDTNHLYRRLPNILGWMFACGIAAHYADTVKRKLLTIGTLLIGWLIFSKASSNNCYAPLAMTLLIVLPHIKLPKMIIPAIRMIAAASLILYLTHYQFRTVMEILRVDTPLSNTLVAILGGTVVYMLYRPFDEWFRKILSRSLG